MKKGTAILLIICMLISIPHVAVNQANAAESSIEYLSNGDYIVTTDSNISTRQTTMKAGSRVRTYYTGDNVKVFAVVLDVDFEYMYGVEAIARNSSVTVIVYVDNATFVSKSTSTSGCTAYGSGTVRYLGSNITVNNELSCTIYGHLY